MTNQKKPTSEIGTHSKNNQSTANAFTAAKRPVIIAADEEEKEATRKEKESNTKTNPVIARAGQHQGHKPENKASSR